MTCPRNGASRLAFHEYAALTHDDDRLTDMFGFDTVRRSKMSKFIKAGVKFLLETQDKVY